MTRPEPTLPEVLTPAGLARLTRSRRRHPLTAGIVYTYALTAAVAIAVLTSAAQSLAAPLLAALTTLPAGTVAEAVVASPLPVLQSVLIAAAGLLVLTWLLTRLGPLGLPEPVRVWLFQHPNFSPAWLRRRLSAVILGGVAGGILIGSLAVVPHLSWQATGGAVVFNLGITAAAAIALVTVLAATGAAGALILIGLQAGLFGVSADTEQLGDRLLWAAVAALALLALTAPLADLIDPVMHTAAGSLTAPVALGLAASLALLVVAAAAWMVRRPPVLSWPQLETGSRAGQLMRFGLVTADANALATTLFARLRTRRGAPTGQLTAGLTGPPKLMSLPALMTLPAGLLIGLARTAGVPALLAMTVLLPWAASALPLGRLPVAGVLIACLSLGIAGWLAVMSVRSCAANPAFTEAFPFGSGTCRLLIALTPATVLLPAGVLVFLPLTVQLGQPVLLALACLFALICAATATHAALRPPPNWLAPAVMTEAGALPVGVIAQLTTPILMTVLGALGMLLAATTAAPPSAAAVLLTGVAGWAISRLSGLPAAVQRTPVTG
ncbi:hypothetical protein [Brevibacterium gallinarum]|uniref:ABC-2 type transport system permease protein n=1 Tax=Brevibacterium gallinarum TaxID=2762220 RepID=A0ABR8WRR9_9MICO|nr:hypothetical protein [Brevibacterium gallinarum]MBD8019769.1 hypothetical protein [Brevibacterium gallinarum]